jgi:hypothetical protein
VSRRDNGCSYARFPHIRRQRVSAIPSRPGKTRINKCLRALSTLIHSTPAPTRCYIGAERVNCFCLTRFLGLGPGIPLLGLFRVKRGVLVAVGRRLLDQGGRPPAERNSTNGRPDLREVQGGSEGRGQFRYPDCARSVVAKAHAVLSEPELLRAMFDVDDFPPNTPPGE